MLRLTKILNLKNFCVHANFDIINHPFMTESKKHLNLIKILEEMMIDKKNKINKTIFFKFYEIWSK